MLRVATIFALIFQLACCPVVCRLGVCPCCEWKEDDSQVQDQGCACCKNRNKALSAATQICDSRSETMRGADLGKLNKECRLPRNSTPCPDQSDRGGNTNCICHGAIKSNASTWTVDREVSRLVSFAIVSPSSIEYSQVMRCGSATPFDSFLCLTGRQIRTWQQSFLC
jgi:hypothetical protein